MNWNDRIVPNPDTLLGKPAIKGSRLAVEFNMGLLAQGWAEEDIPRDYPGLAPEDIIACLRYSSPTWILEHESCGSG